MPEPIDNVLSALERADRRGIMTRPGERWQYQCPAHDDRKPSLTVTRKADGAVLLKCHAGCSTEAVLSSLGLEWKDLFPDAPDLGNVRRKGPADQKASDQKRTDPVYPKARAALLTYGLGKPGQWWAYQDAKGDPVMVVARWDRNGQKTYRPVHRTPAGWKRGALPVPRPLYNLPAVLNAPPETPIVVVEGEKCADAAKELGFVATTSPNGASNAEYADWTPLAGSQVWIIPDHDETGITYAEAVTKLAYEAGAREVKVLRWGRLFPEAYRTLETGFDLADLVEGFRQDPNAEQLLCDLAERIRTVAAETPPEPRPGGKVGQKQTDSPLTNSEGQGNSSGTTNMNIHDSCEDEFDLQPVSICLADVQPSKVEWLWEKRIPLGRITLLVGKPGQGKSFVACDFAARLTTGTPWPDGAPCPRGSVLFMTLEDDPADTIRPRLDACFADVSKVHLLKGVNFREANGQRGERSITLADLGVIERELERLGDCKLLVIDPVGDFLGSRTDAHRDNEVRAVLGPLAELARKHKVAVLVIMHRRKSISNGDADETALGSRGFTGIARSVWHVMRDPSEKKRRLLLPGKQNLAEEQPGLAFTIGGEPPRVFWEKDPVEMTADDGLAQEALASQPGPKPDAKEEAKAFLLDALANGPRLAKDVKREWTDAHCGSVRTLERAKQELGVECFRETPTGPWYWKRPDCQIAKLQGEFGDVGLTPDCQVPTLPSSTKHKQFGDLGDVAVKTTLFDSFGGPDRQDRQVIGEFGNLGTENPPYPTSTRYSGNPKVVDVESVNRLLLEAAEEDGEVF